MHECRYITICDHPQLCYLSFYSFHLWRAADYRGMIWFLTYLFMMCGKGSQLR
jgi:hypothetical protein